jgi:hypothetical protein
MSFENYYVIPRTVFSDVNPNNHSDSTAGMEIGQVWVNTTTKDIFQCKSNAVGEAKWYSAIFQMDPLANTVPSYQEEINNAALNNNFFFTPEIIYGGNPVIGYDLTIPTNLSALSIGPITIDTGFTVTVDGNWTVV